MRGALDEPQAQYGEIFTSYMIWKRDQETRMELFTGDPWMQLNEFTRAIVVRHIWRALEKLAKGSVVVVDQPPQEWSAQIDQTFDDRGIDPWGEKLAPPEPGPQYAKDASRPQSSRASAAGASSRDSYQLALQARTVRRGRRAVWRGPVRSRSARSFPVRGVRRSTP